MRACIHTYMCTYTRVYVPMCMVAYTLARNDYSSAILHSLLIHF